MAQHNITGLGLGLPHSVLSYPGENVSRRPHERSQSLYDPSYCRPPSANGSSGHVYRPHSTYSGKQSLHSVESVRAMAELDAAAASVVGMVPSIEGVGLMDQSDNSRSYLDTTNVDRDLGGVSVAHLKLARVRARSAPIDVQEDSLDSRTHSRFPRADSLLRLDSNSTSKDLKKLLTTRVRHAPPGIDTNKANASGISSSSSSPIKNDPRASQLEPEKSRPRVEVYLVLTNHVAIEGGCFGGTLIVRTRKPRRGEARHVKIDGGKIRIIGFEGVSETERYAFYQYSAPLSETTEDFSQLYEPDSNYDSDGYRIAQEGTFSVPFTVHVPHGNASRPHKNTPKGVIRESGINAAIKYIILISFKVKDDADNSIRIDKHADLGSISIAHFYRGVELWPAYGLMALHTTEETHPALGENGTVSARTARGLFFGGAGMLHLTAVLHRKVWLAGQQCTVYIGAWNETNKSIKAMTLTIIRNVNIGRPNQSVSSNKKQIAETTLDAVRGPNFGPVTGKGWWAGIEAGGTCEFSHSIEIPADALTIVRTHIIEVSYVLRVTLVTGSLSSNVSVDLPFRIINAISTDGLPAPPPPGLLIGGLKLPKEVPVSFTFDASPKQNSTTLDLRAWSFPNGGWSKTNGLREQDVLEPRNHALDNLHMPDDAGSGLSGFKEDTSFLDRASQVSQISQDTRSSYQLFDGISPGDSVSRLMSQVEDGFNTQEQLPGHQPSQRNSVAGSNILKPAPSAKHRVTFLTPKTANARAMQESSAMSREIDHSSPGTVHLKEPSSRRFILEGSRSTRARPDQAMPQLMDTWNDEDADEVLRSLRMDEGGFDSFHSSQGQELVLNGRVSGPITGSSGSSDPWSARSGSSYSQPSASYPSSVFETSPEQDTDISYGGSYSMKSNSKPHLDSMSKDETPRAGSVARFRPEIVTGPIRASSSRAALIPSISSPMLAKSQSAHVIGSPANQYRRFSPQIATVAQLGEDQPKSAGNIHTASAEAGHVGEQSTIREVTGERSAMVASGSARHSVLLPPSSSTLTVAPDAQAHLRSRSVPEPSGGHPGSATVLTSDATPKSTVRSRVAALEERSRSRPISQYSNASSVNSLLHYK